MESGGSRAADKRPRRDLARGSLHWYTSDVADEEIQHTSESALLTAGWRAMESSRSDALFHDPLAAGLAGERGLRIARTRPEGAWVVAIRTVLIDAFVRSAISSGIDTVINLGAGLDTRPYRMDLPSSLHWIEVDHPILIEGKTAHLSSEVPACSIERVGLDLTDGDARRELFDWIWTTSKARASDSDLPSATRCSPQAVRGRLSAPHRPLCGRSGPYVRIAAA